MKVTGNCLPMGSKGWHQWHNVTSGSKAGGQSLAVYPGAQYLFNAFVTDLGVTQRCKLAGGADRPKRIVLIPRRTLTEELSDGNLHKFSKG